MRIKLGDISTEDFFKSLEKKQVFIEKKKGDEADVEDEIKVKDIVLPAPAGEANWKKPSKNSDRIEVYLKKNKIKYIKNQTFEPDQKYTSIKSFKFNFYLYQLNILIDIDTVKKHKIDGIEFRIFMNRAKDKFSTMNNFRLIRINFGNIEFVEDFLDADLLGDILKYKQEVSDQKKNRSNNRVKVLSRNEKLMLREARSRWNYDSF